MMSRTVTLTTTMMKTIVTIMIIARAHRIVAPHEGPHEVVCHTLLHEVGHLLDYLQPCAWTAVSSIT